MQLAGALATLSGQAAASTVQAINAEDIAPLPGDRWVIASSMAGGAEATGRLLAIDTHTGQSTTLYPAGQAKAAPGSADCAEQVAPAAFKPHGIALIAEKGGRTRLYVVNHGGRESVEMFAVSNGKTPKLRWIGCVKGPAGLFANAVAPLPDGRFFVTNMGRPLDGSIPLSPVMGGEVAAWSPGQGWQSVPGSAVVAPNGLLAAQNGKTLYVASWSGKAIVELKLDVGETGRRAMALDFLPDNLRWSRRGTILVVGQATSAQTVIDCYTSAKAHCEIPSAVAEISLPGFALVCRRQVQIDMATVAADVGREMWVGTARGNMIERRPSPVCDAP